MARSLSRILLAAPLFWLAQPANAELPNVLWEAEHGGDVTSVDVLSRGGILASGTYGADTSARLWDADTGSLIDVFPNHQHGVISVSLSPDERLLAVGYVYVDFYHGIARTDVYDLQTKQMLYRFGGVRTAFSADGSRLATAGGLFNRDVYVHAIPSAQRIADIYTGDYVWGMALAPGGQVVATCAGKPDVVIWDVNTGLEVRRLQGHQGGVGTLAFSADGTLIASGVSEQNAIARIKIWRVADGQLLQTLDGHVTGVVNALAFSPDGRKLLSCGRDVPVGGTHSVRLWRVRDGSPIAYYPYEHESFGVADCDYADDGSMITLGLGNGKVIAALPPTGILGDLNCDAVINFGDINPFVVAVGGESQYQSHYPGCDWLNGDIDDDGAVGFADINPFVTLLTSQ